MILLLRVFACEKSRPIRKIIPNFIDVTHNAMLYNPIYLAQSLRLQLP